MQKLKFICSLTLIIQFYSQQTIDSENIKQLVYTQGEAVHYFIGTDPDIEKIPYFQINALNKIDTNQLNYYLEVNSSIYYSDLVLKEIDQNIVQANYKLYVTLQNSSGKVIDKQFKEQKANIRKQYVDDVAFHSSDLLFSFSIEPGDYEIHATLVDANSEKQFQINKEFTLRNYLNKRVLISDIEFLDTKTNRKVISTSNNINNREKDLLILFDTYQVDMNDYYTFGVEVFKKKSTMDNIAEGLMDLVKFITFQTVSDTVFESLYYHGFEEPAKQKFNHRMAIVNKNLFDEIEFSKGLAFRQKLVAKVNSTFHESKRIGIDQFDLDSNIVSVDKANAEKINYKQDILADDGSITIANETIELEAEFSFEWEFIPQTDDEMNYALDQMTYVLEKDSISRIKKKNINDKKFIFEQFWSKYAQEKDRGNPFYAMKQFYRKLEFCSNNFPDLVQLNQGSYQGSRQKLNNNGWASDKAKVYMKYGSPDEIHGNNIFNQYGEMVQYDQKPPVQLWVYNKSGRKYYFRDNMLITNN